MTAARGSLGVLANATPETLEAGAMKQRFMEKQQVIGEYQKGYVRFDMPSFRGSACKHSWKESARIASARRPKGCAMLQKAA